MDLNAVPVAKRSLEAYNKSQSALNDFNKTFEEWGHNCNVCHNYIAQFRNHLVVHKDGSNGHNTRLPNVITTSTIEPTRDLDTLRETRKVSRRRGRGHQCVLCDKFIYQIDVHMSRHFDGSTSNDESEPQSLLEIQVPQNCSETNDVANDELRASSSGNSSTLNPALPNDNDESNCAGENIIFNGDMEPAPPCAPEHVVVTDRTDETRNTDDVPSIASTTSTSVLGDLDLAESSTTEVFQRQSNDDDVENCDETLQLHPNTASLRELSLIPTISNENHQSHDHTYCAREKPILNGDLPPAQAPNAAYMVVTDRSDRTDATRTTDVSAPGDLDPGESFTTEVSQRLESNDHDIENCEETLQPDPNLDTLRASSLILTPANDNHQLHDHTYCAREKLILNGDLEPVPADTHLVVTYRDDRTDETNRTHVSALVELDPRESCRTGISQKLEPHDVNIGNHDEKPQRDANFDTRKESSLIPTVGNDKHQPHVQMNCAGENLTLDADLESVAHGGAEPVVVTDGWNETRSTDVPMASTMSTSGLGDLDPGESSTTEVSQSLEPHDDDIEKCGETLQPDPNADTLRESLSLEPEQDVIDIEKSPKGVKRKKSFSQATKQTRKLSELNVPKKQTPERHFVDLGRNSQSSNVLRLHKSKGIRGKSTNCGATTRFMSEKFDHGYLHASKLAGHRQTHTTRKIHICDTCGNCFTMPSTLTKHKLSHDGQCPTIRVPLHIVEEDLTHETPDKKVENADDTRNDSNADTGNGNVNSGLQLSAQNSIGILSENGRIEEAEKGGSPQGHDHPNCSGENLNLCEDLATSLTDADGPVTNAINTRYQITEVEIGIEYEMSVEKRQPLTQGTTKTGKQKQLISPKRQPSKRRNLGDNLQSSQDLRLRKSTLTEKKSSGASKRSPRRSGRKRSRPVDPPYHIVSDSEESSDEYLIVSAKKRKTLSQVNAKVAEQKELELPSQRLSKREARDRDENSQSLRRKSARTIKKIPSVDLSLRISRKSSRLSQQDGEKAGNYEKSWMSCSDLSSSESEMEESISHKRKKAGKTTQKKEGRLECEICGSRFPYPFHLRRHMLTHTKEKPHECTTCGRCFAQRYALTQHDLTHTGEKPHECGTCGRCFALPSALTQHELTHTREKKYECDVCQRRFTQAGTLTQHKRTHTGGRPKPFTCDICGHGCSSSAELRNHKKVHTGEKSYLCGVCDKSFTFASGLTKHKLIHSKRKDFNCDQCDKRFGQRQHLNQHKLTHTGEKPHKCDVCDKCFTQLSTLIQHKLTHTGERAHKCDVCDKDFSDQSTLAGHKLIHTGVKAHECKVCQKSFISKSSLTRHKRRMHAGVKPHQCRMCNKSFVENYELARHMLTHTGERPYRCDVCKMGFGDQSYLTKHGLTHTGVKPHKCDICQKCFRLKYALTQHETIHTAEKKYKCELCQMCFRLKKGLTQHKKNKHTARHPKVPTWPEDGPPPPGQWVK